MTRSGIPQQIRQLSLEALLDTAGGLREQGWGRQVSYSRKVFIPLTELCRDVCHYCTYAKTPKRIEQPYLLPEQVLEIARAGKARGCREALFTLGDKPELRYQTARDALDRLGYATTVEYVGAMAELVLNETGLLPHLNPGVLTLDEYRQLRPFAPSMGIMLESAAARLCEPGQPHYGSPDKQPEVRLAAIADAGKANVPLTTGILIGIGETREERLESLLAIEAQHQLYGHIQEIIIQNFVPKPDTKMRSAPAPAFAELLWTIAATRILFGPEMSIQVPPNLNEGRLDELLRAGINDWGGVSPVTPDHVNPESPWPELELLRQQSAAAGFQLVERLTVYPHYIENRDRWIEPSLVKQVLHHSDAAGLARTEDWSAGASKDAVKVSRNAVRNPDEEISSAVDRALNGERLNEADIATLFAAREHNVEHICSAANTLRESVNGAAVSYVVNRNINYTNMCTYRCQFCAFSKGKGRNSLRGDPYLLDEEEIARRTEEAWARGATEVCLQGGIHPHFDGHTYLRICATVRAAAPDIHIHAFSPLEITHGATTLGMSLPDYLRELKQAGLNTLPGTAAEILDDEVRALLCADKINSAQWQQVIEAAHSVGLQTTSTIMFGHIETPRSWARHLLTLRDLQARSGGITEFVPLPFVHMEAPIYMQGKARPGPTWREVLLMHAVARLVLHPLIPNIQASWVKLGEQGVMQALNSGVNDLGGTLMNESISRAAGADHGQELPPQRMDELITAAGRESRHRNTLYGDADQQQMDKAYRAPELQPVVNRPARDLKRAS